SALEKVVGASDIGATDDDLVCGGFLLMISCDAQGRVTGMSMEGIYNMFSQSSALHSSPLLCTPLHSLAWSQPSVAEPFLPPSPGLRSYGI
ncbi:unnamed protein product, partial [Closterium sp. Naga37s-1]